jgi:hypothetical protein
MSSVGAEALRSPRSKRIPAREPGGPCGMLGAQLGELFTLILLRTGGRDGRAAEGLGAPLNDVR